jgi:hypothetical protein
MSDNIDKVGAEEYGALSGLVVLITAASVEQTGLVPGAYYEFTATGGTALCRWDTTAAAASDGGFTFAVVPGETKRVRNPVGNTLLNVIEAETGSTATAVLTVSRVVPA